MRLTAFNSPHVLTHAFAVLLASGIVTLFPVLWAWPMILPTTYSLKATQQVINFLIPICAILLGIVLKKSFGITNVAITKASWVQAQLSLGQMQMHYSASKGELWQIFLRAIRNPSIGIASVPVLLTLLSFMAITWALSTVFIVETQSVQPFVFSTAFQPMDPSIQYEMTDIRLSSLMPNADDTCAKSVNSGNCTYDLAIAPLSSLLITRQPYSIAGINFDIDQSTRGVPYDAMFDFWNDPTVSRFNEQTSYYCLPVLVEKTVSCQRDITNSRVHYEWIPVQPEIGNGIYIVTLDPGTNYSGSYPRAAGGNGSTAVMTIGQSMRPGVLETILTATGEWADLLSQLTDGTNSSTKIFTTVCTLTTAQRWNWVVFTYQSNQFHMEITYDFETCSNDPTLSPYEYNEARIPGFKNLPAAFQASTEIVSDDDGYSKYINRDDNLYIENLINGSLMTNSQFDAQLWNMTELELLLSRMYETTQTMYTSTLNGTAPTFPVIKVTDKHQYQISVNWTAITCLSAAAAVLIWACTVWQVIAWIVAVRRIRKAEKDAQGVFDHNLLDELDLMNYSARVVDTIREQQALAGVQDVLKVTKGDQIMLGPEGVFLRDIKRVGHSRGASDMALLETTGKEDVKKPESKVTQTTVGLTSS